MTLKPQPPILWSPDEERKERANLTAFTRWVREHRGVDAPDYEALWRWSVTDLEGFWSAIWEYYRVRAATPYTTVLASDAHARRRLVPRRHPQLRRAHLPRP